MEIRHFNLETLTISAIEGRVSIYPRSEGGYSMAKDPVCGMFVEEKKDTIRHTVEDKDYFFCSTQCLNEFTAPEKVRFVLA